MIEQWKDIPGYEGIYQVSDHGDVRSLDRFVRTKGGDGKWTLRLVPGGSTKIINVKRPIVSLWKNNRGKSIRVCRLVLLAFVGPCPSGKQCCHWDDNPKNNTLSNLRWGTAKENMADRFRNGKQPIGEKHYNSILSESKVKEARRLREKGWTFKLLQKRYGCGFITIYKAVVGKTWSHVA